jgi:DNA-binding response OmpR family regulator
MVVPEQTLSSPHADVLVVDDDRKTVDLVRLYLERSGYSVRVAYDGRQALELARGRRPDLVVLDLMLPHLDGLDVCHVLFDEVGRVPVIMLTARTTEADKLAGLESGADDYVTKPFSPRELVARVKAVLRRAETARPRAESNFGRLTVDHARQQARVDGAVVHLTRREFKLLETLAREPDRPFNRMSLVDRVFGFDYEGLERTVDAHVANLRRKIEPRPSRPIYVLTVPGVGYKLAREPADQENEEESAADAD